LISQEETFLHVLSCADEPATDHCSSALSNLLSSLRKIGTPKKIIEAIKHGFKHWLNSTTQVHALTVGQLVSTATLLTTAFHKQFVYKRFVKNLDVINDLHQIVSLLGAELGLFGPSESYLVVWP
jgi:hypothetical protein